MLLEDRVGGGAEEGPADDDGIDVVVCEQFPVVVDHDRRASAGARCGAPVWIRLGNTKESAAVEPVEDRQMEELCYPPAPEQRCADRRRHMNRLVGATPSGASGDEAEPI